MTSQIELKDFDISLETGFLPQKPPLQKLSSDCFTKWEELVANLPQLIRDKRIRDEICKLPSTTKFNGTTLKSEEEWQRAYVLLTALGQAYTWMHMNEHTDLPDKVPKIIAVPWHYVAQHIGVPPVATYSAEVLYNWRLENHLGPFECENLRAVVNYTGTSDESWFYVVHVQAEKVAAPGIVAVVEALSAVEDGDDNKLIASTNKLAAAIKKMEETLSRMRGKCEPSIFFNKVRHFQKGTRLYESNGIIHYEGLHTGDQYKGYIGSNGAQSSTIHCFDIFFGVKHNEEHQGILDEKRMHMPDKHQKFLKMVAAHSPSVQEYVQHSANLRLVESYNNAVESLVHFRAEHIILVTSYVVNQIPGFQNERGTGGLKFMEFLKQICDSTKEAKIT